MPFRRAGSVEEEGELAARGSAWELDPFVAMHVHRSLSFVRWSLVFSKQVDKLSPSLVVAYVYMFRSQAYFAHVGVREVAGQGDLMASSLWDQVERDGAILYGSLRTLYGG